MTKTGVEYADEQITIYPDCPYNCRYCWASTPLFRYRTRNPKPIQEARRLARSRKPKRVVVSFTTDPYPPRESKDRLTRRTLEILVPTQHEIMILTKNPDMAGRYDLDLLCNENVWLGTTLTALTQIDDEPYAPANNVRASDLYLAHGYGVKTWVSIEPAIPGKTDFVEIIKATHPFVDWYVLGRLDYETRFGYPKIPKGFYTPMLRKAESLLKALGKPYHIKKQLAKNP